VVGNPARLVRKRFAEAQIEELLRIAWWDWPAEVVLQFVGLLNSPNVDEFIAAAKTHRPGGAGQAEAARPDRK
jgi:virginiamycin A acetyltransferase